MVGTAHPTATSHISIFVALVGWAVPTDPCCFCHFCKYQFICEDL